MDFWASWCLPCRKSNPALRKIYSEYASKGLEIFGIADDLNSRENWKAAILKDSIGLWPQILRTGFKETQRDESIDLLDAYFVKYLPTRFLVDKDGRIIGRYQNADIDDLSKDLLRIFKQ